MKVQIPQLVKKEKKSGKKMRQFFASILNSSAELSLFTFTKRPKNGNLRKSASSFENH